MLYSSNNVYRENCLENFTANIIAGRYFILLLPHAQQNNFTHTGIDGFVSEFLCTISSSLKDSNELSVSITEFNSPSLV